eukprot:TRINITY_DN317_c0_g1_i1.p1 TRINITY_DN317_c0_g1~~TRINITY_DN317_c0_g1_i1.p1  ORF type:complete len:331 (+),score=91.24 TRINITY_DN317_c0_g1_i1:29-994(+)
MLKAFGKEYGREIGKSTGKVIEKSPKNIKDSLKNIKSVKKLNNILSFNWKGFHSLDKICSRLNKEGKKCMKKKKKFYRDFFTVNDIEKINLFAVENDLVCFKFEPFFPENHAVSKLKRNLVRCLYEESTSDIKPFLDPSLRSIAFPLSENQKSFTLIVGNDSNNSGGSNSNPGASNNSGGSNSNPGASNNSGGSNSNPGASNNSGGSNSNPGASNNSGGSNSNPGASNNSGGSNSNPDSNKSTSEGSWFENILFLPEIREFAYAFYRFGIFFGYSLQDLVKEIKTLYEYFCENFVKPMMELVKSIWNSIKSCFCGRRTHQD